MGGALSSVLADWTRLSLAQRKLLMACGAGASLVAVYNVPSGGALRHLPLLASMPRRWPA